MPLYQIETNQGVFEIDADREPTQQEALDAISGATPPEPAKTSPIDEQEAYKQRFIKEGTKSPLQRALEPLVSSVQSGIGLADLIKQGVVGLGKTAVSPNALGNLQQTATEIVPRLTYETGNALREALQNPLGTIGSIGAATNPIAAALQALVTPTIPPTQSEAQTAFENELVNREFQKQGEQGIASFGQQQLGLPVAGEANIPTARLAPLVLGAGELAPIVRSSIKTAAAPIKRVITRSLPATAEQSAMAALDLTKEEVARHIPIVNQRVSEVTKAIPKTANQALKDVNTAEASLYQDALAADKLATQQGLAPRADLIIRNVEDTLNKIPNLLPEERIALLEDAKARYTDVSTSAKGRALQQRLNKEFEAQYANETFDRAAPANEVKLAVRNSIAEQMDEIAKAVTGKDASPYSDIGSLIEFKGNLGKTLQRIEGAEARTKTGIGSAKSTNLPITKTQAAYQAKKTILTPLQKTQLEKLNQNVSKIFRKGEKSGEAVPLSPEARQTLIQKYSPQPTPPPLPGETATVLPAADLEGAIQETIQSLPKEMRGRNERSIAEAIVRSELAQ